MGEAIGTILGAPEATNVWYTTEDSFIIGITCGKKWGGLRSLKALEYEKWGGSSLAALQKFTPMSRIEARPTALPRYHADTRWTPPPLSLASAARRSARSLR